MKFFKKIFGKGEEAQMKGIGELDHCPYCKEKLEKVPTRKCKCPHCKEYIYSRTRPNDRKKILIREDQIKELENEWSKYYEEKEKSELYAQEDFNKARDDLAKQFEKEPSLNDVKWRVYNQRIIEYASQRQWGLYSNNKLDMAFLLQKENKLKQALMTMFEVLYLDVNGGRNYGFTGEQLDSMGIKEFDPKTAFLAPGVIGPVQDIISELNLSMTQAKELFIQTNKQMKPSKNMPLTEEKAWEQIQKEISIREANSKKIQEFDPEDTESIIKEIKSSNKETLSSIVYKFRDQYKNKSAIVPNKNKIEKVIQELLITNEETKRLGQSLLLFYLKKDNELFLPLAKKYIRDNKKYFEKCPEEHTIGEIGKINSNLVSDLIPIMIKELKSNSEWNTRRFIAFNLGAIGSKNSEAVKEAIPIMIEYIKNPIEVTKREPTRVEAKGIVIEMNLSAENMLGVAQTQWLKDAYIDSLGMIAQGDKDLIKPYKALFEKIAKKDKSEYSRKKASAVLEKL